MVVLPVPLRPTSPTLSPARSLKRGVLEGDPAPDLDAEVADLQHGTMVARGPGDSPDGLPARVSGLSWVTGR